MNITAELHGKTVVFMLSGRFDSFGAKEVKTALDERLTPDIVCAVLDFREVPYLSSAGVRVIALASKNLKARGGMAVLSSLGGYSREVLETSGLTRFFQEYENVDFALEACAKKVRDKESLDHWEFLEKHEAECGSFRFVPGSDDEGEIRVLGNVRDVLNSTVSRNSLYSKKFSEAGYSVGLGGLGERPADYYGIMGEMITIGGTMVWMPTDGNAMPDFLIPRNSDAGMTLHTGFNVCIAGGFNERVMFESAWPQGTTLGEICRALFELSRKRRTDYKGVLGMAGWLEIGELYGSYVKKSPVDEHRPDNGEPIMSPANIREWVHVDEKPLYRGATCLMCGVGADMGYALAGHNRDLFDSVFYSGPDSGNGSGGDSKQVLHNHGVVFSNVEMPERMVGLEEEISKVVMKGDFRDMRHLMDTTTVTRGFFGLSYTRNFQRDPMGRKGGRQDAGDTGQVARRLAEMRYGVR